MESQCASISCTELVDDSVSSSGPPFLTRREVFELESIERVLLQHTAGAWSVLAGVAVSILCGGQYTAHVVTRTALREDGVLMLALSRRDSLPFWLPSHYISDRVDAPCVDHVASVTAPCHETVRRRLEVARNWDPSYDTSAAVTCLVVALCLA